MECLWVSIFSRFWWILEAKLASKIHPNRSDLAWRGVMARRGEAWRCVARRGVARRGVEGAKGVKRRIWRAWKTGARGLTQSKGVYCLEKIPPSPYFYVDVYMKRSEETFLSKVASLRRIPWGLMAPKKELPGKNLENSRISDGFWMPLWSQDEQKADGTAP